MDASLAIASKPGLTWLQSLVLIANVIRISKNHAVLGRSASP